MEPSSPTIGPDPASQDGSSSEPFQERNGYEGPIISLDTSFLSPSTTDNVSMDHDQEWEVSEEHAANDEKEEGGEANEEDEGELLGEELDPSPQDDAGDWKHLDLSESELEMIRDAFAQKAGGIAKTLNKKQFCGLMTSVCRESEDTEPPAKKDLEKAFLDSDTDKTGTVDFEEFAVLFVKVKKGEVQGLAKSKGFSFSPFKRTKSAKVEPAEENNDAGGNNDKHVVFSEDAMYDETETAWNSLFRDLDTDKSGTLTRKEILERLMSADEDLLQRFQEILDLPGIDWRDKTKANLAFEKAWKEMDTDFDTEITLREFRVFCRNHLADAEEVDEDWDDLFKDLDTDRSGTLTKKEIMQRLKTFDQEHLEKFSEILHLPNKINWKDGTKAKFEKAWKEMDADDDKEITLKEFRSYCRKFLMDAGVVKEEWDILFADLDIDNSGTLTKKEILQRLSTADDGLLDRFSDILRLPKKINWRDGTKAKFEKAWKEMDADSDKEVSLREFRLYCRQFLVDEGIVKEEWDELFKDLDTDNSGTLTKKEVLQRLSTADDELLDRFSDILQLPKKLSMMDGSKRKFEKAWKEMDVDGDKEVSLKEFRIFCRKFLVEGEAEELAQAGSENPADDNMIHLTLTAPPGAMPGSTMDICAPTGEIIQVTIPLDLGPDRTFEAKIPNIYGQNLEDYEWASVEEEEIIPIVSTWSAEVHDVIVEMSIIGEDEHHAMRGGHFDQRESFFAHHAEPPEESAVIYCFQALGAMFKDLELPAPSGDWTRDTSLRWPIFVRWRRFVPDPNLKRLGRSLLPAGEMGSWIPQPLTVLPDLVRLSATEDPFNIPIKKEWYEDLDCTVMLITSFEMTRDVMDWELGVHGLLISFEDHKGVVYAAHYLPDLPIYSRWTKEFTVDTLIRKAGYRGHFDHHFKKTRIVLTRFQVVEKTMSYTEVDNILNPVEEDKEEKDPVLFNDSPPVDPFDFYADIDSDEDDMEEIKQKVRMAPLDSGL